MRTNEERICLVQQGTAAHRRRMSRRRRHALDALCMASCLLLVACLGAWMSELTKHVTQVGAASVAGAASLIGEHSARGYILMGLLAFLLGVCVTVSLYRLRRRDVHRRREDEDEL